MIKKRKDLVGEKFGRLVVIERADDALSPNGKRRCDRWTCKCDCGNTTTQYSTCLKKGGNQSCGCYRIEMMQKRCWKGYGEISGSYFNRLQRDAKDRNLEWSISIDYCWDVFLKQNRNCAITELPLEFRHMYKKESQLQTASLDRIDNSDGYVEGNVQWVHKDINVMKWAFSMEKFYFLCDLVLKNKTKYIETYDPKMQVKAYENHFGPRVNLL